MAPDPTALFPGMDFCQGFRLRRLLGKGGYGCVWESDSPEGSAVALKFLRREDGAAAVSEIKAIQNVMALRHPNVVRILRVWLHGGYVVVTMPLAEGSLLDLYEACVSEYGRAMVPDEVCPLLIQAAEGLDFLNTRQHRIGSIRVAIQHCDVKPSNLLLFGDTVALCDFGFSTVTTTAMKPHRPAGSLEYAAPEVFQGRLSDHTDQYSLGVTYCFLRGGLPIRETPAGFDPFYARPEPDLSFLTEPERPIVARALASVPPERWPTCKEFILQLQKCTALARRR